MTRRAKAPAPASQPVMLHGTRRMPIGELKGADYNPRKIADASLAALSASLDEFGLVQPIVWNKRSGRVVGGHQRLRVLADRGVTEVDVTVVDLDQAKEKALNVALNSPGLAGRFTGGLDEVLAEIEPDLGELFGDLGFDELVKDDVGLPPRVVDVSDVGDEFWLAARGPLPAQADAIEMLREALEGVEGVEVNLGIVKR